MSLFSLPGFFRVVLTWANVQKKQRVFSDLPIFLLLFAGIVFFAFRTGGTDYYSYKISLEGALAGESLVYDIGYRLLERVTASVGLPINSVLVLLAGLQIFAIYRLSRLFNLEFIALLALFCMHLYVVRDLSQMRIAMSIYIVFLAINRPTKVKIPLYLVAVSIHLTGIMLIAAYEFTKRFSWRSRKLIYIGFLPIALTSSSWFLSLISGLDPRISLYLARDSYGYGLPVGDYSMLLFHLGILIAGLLTPWIRTNKEFSRLLELQLIGLLIFIFFRDVSIFASRLTNVVTSFYPLIILGIITRPNEIVFATLDAAFPVNYLIARWLALAAVLTLIVIGFQSPVIEAIKFF